MPNLRAGAVLISSISLLSDSIPLRTSRVYNTGKAVSSPTIPFRLLRSPPDFSFSECGGMIGCDHVNRAVKYAFNECISVRFGTNRRVHFEASAVNKIFITQNKIMRCSFTCYVRGLQILPYG